MLKKLSLLTVLLCQSIAISSSSLVMTPGSSGVVSSGELMSPAPDDEDEMAILKTIIGKNIVPLFDEYPVTDAESLKIFVTAAVEKIKPYEYGDDELAELARYYVYKKKFMKSALLYTVLVYTLHSVGNRILSDIYHGYIDSSGLPADLQIDPNLDLGNYFDDSLRVEDGKWWQTLYKIMKIIECDNVQ